jgi:hypothetical protein
MLDVDVHAMYAFSIGLFCLFFGFTVTVREAYQLSGVKSMVITKRQKEVIEQRLSRDVSVSEVGQPKNDIEACIDEDAKTRPQGICVVLATTEQEATCRKIFRERIVINVFISVVIATLAIFVLSIYGGKVWFNSLAALAGCLFVAFFEWVDPRLSSW